MNHGIYRVTLDGDPQSFGGKTSGTSTFRPQLPLVRAAHHMYGSS